ncbi:heme-binding protein [Pelomonas sp. UHG3]|uniref:Heme-binding protein n=1 Tax=Roseateles hydrophilus TaxID=2975054 RepID=A0ACC6CCL4_9BURK|nr:heme-binding protein [Pelomonas sp. UHG3]MCY4746115.1 heme-binding protein [Pelomonas sp. UHG3]
MKRRLVLLTALSLSMTTTHAIEEPAYQVLAQDGAFELRQYEPMLQAQVEVEGDAGEARNAGFRLLAGYIFGGNQGQRKIAMTAPVTQAPAPVGEKIAMTAPVTQAAAGPGRWRITFTMPRAYTLETLPQPNDARVQFVVVPGEKRAVVRFAGLSTESNLGRHQAQLQAWVQQRGLQPQGDYVTAFYNDPFTLPWNRRNEWWVAVQ